MAFSLANLVGLAGWFVATAIVFRAWQRFPSQGSKLALIGFLLGLSSTLLRLGARPFLLAQDISRITDSVVFSLLGFPSLVGIILIVYAFWVMVRCSPSVQPPEGGN